MRTLTRPEIIQVRNRADLKGFFETASLERVQKASITRHLEVYEGFSAVFVKVLSAIFRLDLFNPKRVDAAIRRHLINTENGNESEYLKLLKQKIEKPSMVQTLSNRVQDLSTRAAAAIQTARENVAALSRYM